MRSGQEKRKFVRSNATGRIWLRWVGADGAHRGVPARALDVSSSGVGLALQGPLEAMTYVHIESRDLRLTGIAMVRHCGRKGLHWVAGLQTAARDLTYS